MKKPEEIVAERWAALEPVAQKCATERLNSIPSILIHLRPLWKKLLMAPRMIALQTAISWRYRPRAALIVQCWFALKWGVKWTIIFLANVRGEVSLLAFGTQACSAGDVPKVPKGQGLPRPPRSAIFFS